MAEAIEKANQEESLTVSNPLSEPIASPPFSYKPLVGPHSIRLLTFQTLQSGRIAGTLKSVDLAADISYSALSYTWQYRYSPGSTLTVDGDQFNSGDDGSSASKCNIHIDGHPLSITPNLRDALLQLHASELNSSLWVDSICINQNDTAERSAQVNLMGEIYSTASQVIVWLGTENAETELCRYLISMFARISKRVLAVPQKEWNYFEYKLQGRLFSCGMPHHMDMEWWRMLARFLQRTWFGRLWTLQEVALKTRDTVTVLCGSQAVLWDELVALSDVLAYTGLATGILELMPGSNSEAVGRTLGTYADFQNMCRGKKFFELQHEQLWGLTPHVRVTGPIKYTMQDELLEKPPPAQNTGAVLLFLMSQCMMFHASDPRDKVFALLGMAKKVVESSGGQTSQIPTADYAMSVEDVYYKVFRFVMEITQRSYNIAFVGDVGKKNHKDLPSWVGLSSIT